MKAIILFLIKLVVLSLLALPTAKWFDNVYQSIVQWGVVDKRQIPFIGSHMLYLFFVLVLATPRLGACRRLFGIFAAILLYLLIDRLMIPVWSILPYTQKPGPIAAKVFYTNIYYMIMHWLLPFLLWFIVAGRYLGELFRRDKETVGDVYA